MKKGDNVGRITINHVRKISKQIPNTICPFAKLELWVGWRVFYYHLHKKQKTLFGKYRKDGQFGRLNDTFIQNG